MDLVPPKWYGSEDPRRTQLAEQSYKNKMICSKVRRIFVIIKNGKNGSINNLESVSMNRHVGLKMYEPSKVSVR